MYYKNYFKRIFDLTFALLLVIAMALPMLAIAVLIRVTSQGDALFRQTRYTLDSRPFTIYKFRTMVLGTPEIANQEFKDRESYETKLGRFLRKTSLDELPQIINVLKGEMSFIGPRPLAITDKYVLNKRRDSGADSVRPGISGLAQVRGRNEISDDAKAMYDKEYADKVTLSMDIYILKSTLVNVVRQTGINKKM